MPKNILLFAALALAVFLPLTAAIKAKIDLGKAEVIRVDIAPYDPRDLLYGHYMQFQFNWNWKNIEETANACTNYKNCCLCVEEGKDNPAVSVMNCDAAQNLPVCKYSIKGKSYGPNQFDTGLNRFFVDERFALPLEKIFRAGQEKFRVGLFVRDGAKPVLEKLYVGDKSLEDYLAFHGGTVPDVQEETQEPLTP